MTDPAKTLVVTLTLGELDALLDRKLAPLRDAIRAGKTRGSRRSVAVAGKVAARSAAVHQPSEIEIQAAAKALAKRRRSA